jgi:hypothetical protein
MKLPSFYFPAHGTLGLIPVGTSHEFRIPISDRGESDGFYGYGRAVGCLFNEIFNESDIKRGVVVQLVGVARRCNNKRRSGSVSHSMFYR